MKIIILTIFVAAFFSMCERAPQDPSKISSSAKPQVTEMSPSAASSLVEQPYTQFIDVRTKEEFTAGHAARARNIPLDRLADDMVLLRSDEPVYIICRTDNRSRQAAELLTQKGFKQAIVVTGGTEAWQKSGLPMRSAEGEKK
jgi:rhodanese-related sulfurtransferase